MTADMITAGISASFGAAFLIGLSFGSGPCNLSCLPYLGPVLLGPSVERPLGRVILPFMSGRLLGYTLLGLIAALMGQTLNRWLAHPGIPVFVALVTLWLAWQLYRQSLPENRKPLCHQSEPLSMPPEQEQATAQAPEMAKAPERVKIRAEHNAASSHTQLFRAVSSRTASRIIATDAGADKTSAVHADMSERKAHTHIRKSRPQLFVLGFSLALNPCVPLLGLLAAAAQTGEPLTGALLALAFGAGAVIIPMLLVRYGVALLGQALREHLARWQNILTRTGAALLVLVAISSAWQGWSAMNTVS